jgi:hypothetical protein
MLSNKHVELVPKASHRTALTSASLHLPACPLQATTSSQASR